jgi:hypothetical protein
MVTSGGIRVPEELTVQPFYSEADRLEMLVSGHAPQPIEFLAEGRFAPPAAGSGPELILTFPPVPTVPEGQPMSIVSFNLALGSAARRKGRATYYLTLPRRGQCPKGGFPFAAELAFATVGSTTSETVRASYRSVCPRAGDPSRLGTQAPQPEPPPPPPPPPPQPSPTPCVSKRHFTIHVDPVRGVAYREVSVFVNGHRVKVVRGRRSSAAIDLRGLPQGTYTVRIVAVTTDGRTIASTRKYHTCVAQVGRARQAAR